MNKELHLPNLRINSIEEKIIPYKKKLMNHSIYKIINDEYTLRTFMENHVYSVWDFQSLLKSLQRNLSCVEIPWRPTYNPEARRLINEIVLDEESGNHPNGGYTSHFELYREAMIESGADVTKLNIFLKKIEKGGNTTNILRKNICKNTIKFVETTFKYIYNNNICALMAIFTYGREDIIPTMFEKIINSFNSKNQSSWYKFKYYLNEHIICDRDRHGPMAKKILSIICENDEKKWEIAEFAAIESLKQRIIMWDNIEFAIKKLNIIK